MPNFSLPISVFLVILVANQTSAVPQDGLAIHTKGRVQVILESPVSTVDQCIGEDGFCVFNGGNCNGSITTYYNSLMDHCICCIPENQVSTLDQCIEEDGFCVSNGESCNGSITTFYTSMMDHCVCCISENQECPEGGFVLNGKCYKIFKDVTRSWEQAKEKCREERMLMAMPSDVIAVELRQHLLDTYGDGEVWLSGRGDGSNIVFEHDGKKLLSGVHLWWPGLPGRWTTTDHCQSLMVTLYYRNWQPRGLFGLRPCPDGRYTLCERN